MGPCCQKIVHKVKYSKSLRVGPWSLSTNYTQGDSMVKNLFLRTVYLHNFCYYSSRFLRFEFLKIRSVGLFKIHYDSTRSLSGLYEESVMALGGVRHGSVSNPSWLWEESVT